MKQNKVQPAGWLLVRLQHVEEKVLVKPLTRIDLPRAEDALARGRELYPRILRSDLAIELPKGDEK